MRPVTAYVRVLHLLQRSIGIVAVLDSGRAYLRHSFRKGFITISLAQM